MQPKGSKNRTSNNKKMKRTKSITNLPTTHDINEQAKKYIEEHRNEKKQIGVGGFNIIDSVGNYILRKPESSDTLSEEEQQQGLLNIAFVSSLLHECGEPTLQYGKTNQNEIFTRKKDYFEKDNKIDKDNPLYTLQRTCEILRHDNLLIRDLSAEDLLSISNKNPVRQFSLSNEDGETILKNSDYAIGLFCRIALLSLFDRKSKNIVFKKNKNGTIIPYDIDFDDLGDDCQIIFQSAHGWGGQNMLDLSIQRFNDVFEHVKKNKPQKEYNELLQKLKARIARYTLNETQIKNIIKNTTKQAFYLGLDKDFVKKQTEKMLERWQSFSNEKVTVSFTKNEEIKQALKKSFGNTQECLKHQYDVERMINEVYSYCEAEKSAKEKPKELKNEIKKEVKKEIKREKPVNSRPDPAKRSFIRILGPENKPITLSDLRKQDKRKCIIVDKKGNPYNFGPQDSKRITNKKPKDNMKVPKDNKRGSVKQPY